jgi:signal transduction histidine kinase
LANAAKHSRATTVWLRVTLQQARLVLVVEDNGGGFAQNGAKPGRNGLKNIQARMQHLNGRGTIHSVVGQGTRVELELLLH